MPEPAGFAYPEPPKRPGEVESDTPASLEDQFAAEFADHLASSALEFERRGLSPDESQRQANEEFGNQAAVRQTLWWIHEGDQVMWRAGGIACVVGLVIALVGVTWQGWRAQRALESQLGALTEQLGELNRWQKERGQGDAERFLEIRGYAYLGDPPTWNQSLGRSWVPKIRFPPRLQNHLRVFMPAAYFLEDATDCVRTPCLGTQVTGAQAINYNSSTN